MKYDLDICHAFLRLVLKGNPSIDSLYGFTDKNGNRVLSMDFLLDIYDMFKSVVNNETQAEFVNRMRFIDFGDNNG